MIVSDFLLLIGVFYISLHVRTTLDNTIAPKFDILLIEEFYFVIFIVLAMFIYERIYTFRYDFWQETQKILKSLVLSYFIVLSLLTLSKTSLEYSRLFITLYFGFALLLIPIGKRYIKKLIYSISFFRSKVLLLGNEDQIEIFEREFENNWYLGLKSNNKKYDTVIIASKDMTTKEINKLISKYLDKKSELFIVPYITAINFAHSNIMEYSNIRVNAIHIENKLLIKQNIFIKNIFDKFITFILLPFFLILHFIISLLIKINSKGMIFFKQPRLGKDHSNFLCYKYRTMYEDSDILLQNYLKKHPEEIKYYEHYHKYKNDPRVTKVGKFLRTTSLDELPQMINILKGEMSLVGPRPYMVTESKKLGKKQDILLKVKPGITGLWQVSGRNNLTFEQRNQLEIWYIKNWSLWADLVILIKTIKVVLSKVGAR
jgi:undecaprenyl-phosphate galactose phosphotransferase